ncbi:hypothetical protein CVT26_000852 [Gymnopilus dilepis]|uniref:DNA 3'-5' helicase n=1 Tax=Gymnopilus dilepis TaxID=231916 RepID=A0A409YMP3_9AGAR|nr:hypothetical protein CVT26_000852 [Gymnopilus dilepis]
MLEYSIPSLSEVLARTEECFGVKPHLFQAEDAISQLQRQDTITISPTGSGKTLTFWIPLLFNDNGIKIVVTSLNILGDQNVSQLEKLGIRAVNLTKKTATNWIFKEIEQCKYRVIVASPERLLNDGRFSILWESKKFVSRLFNISFDEGHCISQWGDFRPEYGELGRLRWLIPSHIRFHVVSATMPDLVLKDVKSKLQMRSDTTTVIHLSNDRPNIHIVVEQMDFSASSKKDLARILNLKNGTPPPKFLVFTNKRLETEEAVREEWKCLPDELRDKIVWFHSGMSAEFRAEAIERLKKGELWGLFCTDAAGMGLDIPDIELIIQWRYVPSLCTLFQRVGRAGRGKGTRATGIYLVEPQYFDGHKNKVIGKRKRSSKAKYVPQKMQRTEAPVRLVTEQEEEVVEEEEDEPGERDQDVGVEEEEGDVPLHPTARGEARQYLVSLPATTGLAPDEYEAIAMDLFINARLRGRCRRGVINEYFGNQREGEYSPAHQSRN